MPLPDLGTPPEWWPALRDFKPRFPGDGFSHDLDYVAPIAFGRMPAKHLTLFHADHNPCPINYGLDCPCGTAFILSGNIIRKDGDSDIVGCKTCGSWHSILWHAEAPQPAGGKFIIAGTLSKK